MRLAHLRSPMPPPSTLTARATYACPLLPTALASMPFGFVLARVWAQTKEEREGGGGCEGGGLMPNHHVGDPVFLLRHCACLSPVFWQPRHCRGAHLLRQNGHFSVFFCAQPAASFAKSWCLSQPLSLPSLIPSSSPFSPFSLDPFVLESRKSPKLRRRRLTGFRCDGRRKHF